MIQKHKGYENFSHVLSMCLDPRECDRECVYNYVIRSYGVYIASLEELMKHQD